MAKNKMFRWITEPVLDVMQTIPSLSYLVPAVAFFGISQPPAVLATVVFAIPPMVKLTALGSYKFQKALRKQPSHLGRQTDNYYEGRITYGHSVNYGRVKPNNHASSLHGHNLCLYWGSGLGALVTESLGDAQAGKGLLAGIAIALVAMMIDRILRGIRARSVEFNVLSRTKKRCGRITMKKLLLGAALSAALFATGTATAQEKVMISDPSWNGARAVGHVIKAIITEQMGGEAEILTGMNQQPVIFAGMDKGDGQLTFIQICGCQTGNLHGINMLMVMVRLRPMLAILAHQNLCTIIYERQR